MKTSFYSAIILAGITCLMVSCDDGDKKSLVTASDSQSMLPMPATPTTSADPAAGSAAIQSQPVSMPTTAGAGVKLNPKHGEPGHRCDIPVGSPLDQPASQAPVVVNTPAVSVPSTPVASAAGVKLNPKHGEPGHRCDIAVGAPLNSAPASPAAGQPAPVINTQPVVASPQPTPAAASLGSGNGLPAPKLQLPLLNGSGTGKVNPKHGEPGHRCDIAVGAPLN